MPVWCDHVTVTSSDKKVFVIGGYQLSETASLTPSSQVQVHCSGALFRYIVQCSGTLCRCIVLTFFALNIA